MIYIILHIYSFLILGLFQIIKLASLFNPYWKRQLFNRGFSDNDLKIIEKNRASYKNAALFFCSSAGEYEQARPLIDRLLYKNNVYILIIFFSRSGYDFAVSRKETLPFFLSPPDIIWRWNKIFAVLRPSVTIVMRHEYWPAFSYTAHKNGSYLLADACKSRPISSWSLARYAKTFMLNYFDKIFVVQDSDLEFFFRQLKIPPTKLVLAGDTKYDRVYERAIKETSNEKNIQKLFDNLSAKKRLIIGSAWKPEVECVLDSFLNLNQKNSQFRSSWQVIIVPHDIGSSMLEWIEEACASRHLNFVRFSELESLKTPASTHKNLDVIIVDKMGKLAEVYGTGHLAIVGGALHHKIHNVLEPSIKGLPLAFGPLYTSAKEATLLVEQKLVTVVKTPHDLEQWWENKNSKGAFRDEDLFRFVKSLCGASDLIFKEIIENISKENVKNA